MFKSFVILALLRRNVQQVGGACFHVIAPGNTTSFEKVSQRWRAVGNTVSRLIGRRFTPQTFHSRDERVTARSTGWLQP